MFILKFFSNFSCWFSEIIESLNTVKLSKSMQKQIGYNHPSPKTAQLLECDSQTSPTPHSFHRKFTLKGRVKIIPKIHIRHKNYCLTIPFHKYEFVQEQNSTKPFQSTILKFSRSKWEKINPHTMKMVSDELSTNLSATVFLYQGTKEI